ncbi:autotransporter outer membrane beta-barrel domain-containing protein [Aquamicrobium zhengzhouense]|uniref:Autotransporter outer membrane beta-barrel domain-containing protein n=1 Tax=Aquamicrobium zhengzhouense TaxID=2781738 RepID=A0ABS0SGF3_9HYPH|nr:autotransporter outer membrane beta-barrel domain-containing protein [Aquamicrobium zhengzhouense]MBI1622385.1 autotransporter outer membrane beta-barrel domain-containing protein [Aquamicrobium zhengzhouense]
MAATPPIGHGLSGFALGVHDLQVGKVELAGPAIGAYWTHYSPSGGYLDGVVQWNWMKAYAHSDFGTRMSTRGTGFTASLEAGQPFVIADGWQLEPQAQIIYQTVSFRDSYDAFTTLAWDEDDAVTGRLGMRLQYTSKDGETVWQPYVKANLWHSFSGTDHTILGPTTLDTRFGGTSLELGAGLTARLTDTFSLYGHVDHRWSISGGGRGSATGGAVGLRVNW